MAGLNRVCKSLFSVICNLPWRFLAWSVCLSHLFALQAPFHQDSQCFVPSLVMLWHADTAEMTMVLQYQAQGVCSSWPSLPSATESDSSCLEPSPSIQDYGWSHNPKQAGLAWSQAASVSDSFSANAGNDLFMEAEFPLVIEVNAMEHLQLRRENKQDCSSLVLRWSQGKHCLPYKITLWEALVTPPPSQGSTWGRLALIQKISGWYAWYPCQFILWILLFVIWKEL